MIGGAEVVAVGLNHRTAPVSLRERLAISEDAVPGHLEALRSAGLSQESVILSTCNRVEVYALVPSSEGGAGIARYLARAHGLGPREVDQAFYRHQGPGAVAHLFRVASSLDSLVLGEPQILGQIKDAFRIAAQHRAVGRYLTPLMRRTLTVAKRVRSETRIGQEPVSVGRAGVELARQVFGGLEGRRALLVGAGDTGRLVAQALLTHGVEELVVCNRSYANAVSLAEQFGGTAVHLDQLFRYLEQVDIVVAATGAQHHLLTRAGILPVLRTRRYRPLFLVDLSVPRNIDPEVHTLEGAYLFNIDDLTEVARRGMEHRKDEAQRAEAIVVAEANRCYHALGARSADPVIAAITRQAEEARHQELLRSESALRGLDPRQREVVEAMSRAMFKRFLHNTIAQAHRLGERGDEEGLRLLADIFDPPPEESEDE